MKQIGYSFQVLESEATTEVHVALELLEPLNYDWLQALNKRGRKISFLYSIFIYFILILSFFFCCLVKEDKLFFLCWRLLTPAIGSQWYKKI